MSFRAPTIFQKINSKNRATAFGAYVAIIGLLNISSALLSYTPQRLAWLQNSLPEEIITGSRSLVLVTGFFLISVAWNMTRRKRTAWLVTVWLLTISIISYLPKGLDIEETAISLILLALLLVYRKDFTVKSDPTAFERLFYSAPSLLIIFCIYSLLGFYLLKNDIQPTFNFERVITETFNLITLQGLKYYAPTTFRAKYFIESIDIAAGAVILNLGFNIMRPYIIPETSGWEREKANEILQKNGLTTFSYFTMGDDKSYYFNERLTAYVSYVTKQGVALAAGDPVGPQDDIPDMIKSFKEFSEENGWVPVFNTVEPEYIQTYSNLGFKRVKGGEEAVIDLLAWDMRGKEKVDARSAYNRGKRFNWVFTCYTSEINDDSVINQIRELNEAWLRNKFGGEMGFMMGITPIIGSSETLVATVRDQDGKLLAFMTLAPVYGRQGWIGDHIKRDEGSPNGAIDFLIVSLIFYLKQQGYKILSLGEAPMHGVGEEEKDRVFLERLMKLIYNNFNGIYHYKQLFEFKEKWGPRWENRYIVYPSNIVFPRVTLALASAHLPKMSIRELIKLLQ